MPRFSGELITTPWGSDKAIRDGTISCAHCGYTWVHRPGSKRVRGFCMRCGGHVCSAACGNTCTCVERGLDNLEAGRHWFHRSISSAVHIDLKGLGSGAIVL
ncbi:MAG TPA: hypothetical protein VHC22_32545 [Pirellulales bacterium]|nr:hypothetical protein [Pirellulales bacterium]